MGKVGQYWKLIVLVGLALANLAIWTAAAGVRPRDFVQVSFLDVGQGDAILVESANRSQILIDGGPNRRVLRELSRAMPPFDRFLDVVIETHPDKDHIGGLPEVVNRYTVGAFFEPGVESDNRIDDELHRRVKEKNIPVFLARAGMILDMGDGSLVQILFPDRDPSGMDTNDASIVAKYIFGGSCFLFTGDSPTKIEEYLVSVYDNKLKCDVLKAGHHGSRTSTGDIFVSAVSPSVVVISSGEGNSYGHPHKEVLDILSQADVKILKTAENGTIRIKSDGQTISVK
ncbi:MBL fold metallo-hydrolase [Patescibacteria group bacterium]|nr:MAG: MBL fold metallo-hydrolase [Patescibacteria group bacterium]